MNDVVVRSVLEDRAVVVLRREEQSGRGMVTRHYPMTLVRA